MDRTISSDYQQKLFKLILSFRENRHCADCKSLNPDWASTSLGVFICYKCSGIHRSFGLHITRVKSTSLDSWTLRQLYQMAFVDNKLCNDYWEAKLPQGFIKPTYDSAPNDLISFAKRKYVEREFIIQNTESPIDSLRPRLIPNGEEDTDQEKFFQTKFEELKAMLDAKAEARGHKIKDKEGNEINSNNSKRRGTAQALHPIQRFSVTPRSKDMAFERTILRANQQMVPKSQKEESLMTFSTELNLFKDLNIRKHTSANKEIDMSPKPSPNPNPRRFHRANTQVIRPNFTETSKVDELGSTESPNFPDVSPIRSNIRAYLDEEDIFEGKSKEKILKETLADIEMQEISSASGKSEKNFKSSIHEINEDCYQGLLKNSQIGPSKSNPFEAVCYEAHVKRPSERFEVSKFLAQELPSSRLRKSEKVLRYPILVGCFMLHLVLGYIYSWGSMSLYLASYLMDDYEDDRYIEHTSHNMMIFVGLALGFCFTENLSNAIGMRTVVALSSLGLGGSLMLSSTSQDIVLCSSLLTLVNGFLIGLVYEVPFYCASQYFWSRQIFLKGLFYLGNGLGAFGYSYLSYYYLSQQDTDGELEQSAIDISKIYSNRLSDYIPDFLSEIAVIIFISGFIGTILIHPRCSFVIKDYSGFREQEEGLLTPRNSMKDRFRRKASALVNQGLKEALMSPGTKVLISFIILYSMLGSYLLCSYKYLGLMYNYSDAMMSLVGGAGVFLLCVGKMVGVIIHPKYEFKTMCRELITYQLLAGILLVILSQLHEICFLIFLLAIMFFDGLMLSLVIQEIKFVHTENIEDCMVALVILGYAVANFISFMIVKPLILLNLRGVTILVLTVPLLFTYRIYKQYSRASARDNSDMISMILAV